MAERRAVHTADTASHLTMCAGVLAGAFADDPLMSSIWPEPGRRRRALRAYFAATLRHEHSVIGVVEYICVDGEPAAVAAWDGPARGGAIAGLRRTARAAPELVSALRERLPVGIDVRRRLDRHEPSEPHWTLVNLGVAESFRGTGLARTLVDHRLSAVDAQAQPAHLVCTRAENVPLYERFAFSTTAQFALRDGTPLWAMDRSASGTQ